MNNADQYELPMIPHAIDESSINQRAIDGYINATEMCKAAGKRFNNYSQLSTSKDYLKELSLDTGISVSKLMQTFIGRPSELQGTWVHPHVAMHLAQWLSPKFAVQVSKWVSAWISGQARQSLPDHVRRYIVNQHKIPNTHFSMLNQMILRLLAPLETHGYIVPDELMPDIALGKRFSNKLRTLGRKPEDYPTYKHRFLDNRLTVPARLYPNEVMTEFNEWFDEWLRTGEAEKYFSERDPESIEALDKVLALPPPSVT